MKKALSRIFMPPILLCEKSFASRKYWAAVVASVPFAYHEAWQFFALVWMFYAAVQGFVDAFERVGAEKKRLK
jgi:hypothetical protein